MNLNPRIPARPAPRTTRRGVALVITLLMLSVITFLAIAFLSLTSRDKAAVTATLDLDTSKTMADAALARAEANILAQIEANNDLHNFDYSVSHNFPPTPNPPPFNPSSTNYNFNNVNYDWFNTQTPQGSLNPGWAQNIANLFYDPRPPVFIMTNGNQASPLNEFRYYVDLNRNSQFESNGLVTAVDVNGIPTGGLNYYNGEPEFIGVLKYPETNHSPINPFIGRYAFMILPIGKTLDWNYIHNYSRLDGQAMGSPGATQDWFSRDQGVGSWELNLAALLYNINTNMYPPLTAYNYQPLLFTAPSPNTGSAFDDAVQFIRYRYSSNQYATGLNPYPLTLQSSVYFTNTPLYNGLVDLYGNYPSLNDYNQTTATNSGAKQNPNTSWPGAYNTNTFYSVQDLFDPNKTGSATSPNGGGTGLAFSTRLYTNSTYADTYDRYTMQRLLSVIGTGSTPDYTVYVYSNSYTAQTNGPFLLPITVPPLSPLPNGWVSSNVTMPKVKLNLNFNNLAQIQAGPGALMPTNLFPWSYDPPTTNSGANAQAFFNYAADLILRSQTFSYSNIIPLSRVNGVTNWQYTNSVIATFGATNIPIFNSTNLGIYYSDQIHRSLQLAANIYAAANPVFTNTAGGATSVFGNTQWQVPPVFRPQFQVLTTNGAVEVFITNFVKESPATEYNNIAQGYWELTNALLTNAVNANFWGIPWVIGAVKGVPSFDKATYQARVYFARELIFARQPTNNPPGWYAANAPPAYTNQFIEMQVSNLFGLDAWNPYSTPFYGTSGQLSVLAHFDSLVTVTNNYNSRYVYPYTNSPTNTYTLSAGVFGPSNFYGWAANGFMTFVTNTYISMPLRYFSESQQAFIPLIPTNAANQTGFLTNDLGKAVGMPTHVFSMTITNHAYYALFDGPGLPGSTLIDFANLGRFGSAFPITKFLSSSNLPGGQQGSSDPSFWVTNNSGDRLGSAASLGVTNQIIDATSNTAFRLAILNPSSISPAATASGIFGIPAPSGYTASAVPAASFTPQENYMDSNVWAECDPIVHYTLSDLTAPPQNKGGYAYPDISLVDNGSVWKSALGTASSRFGAASFASTLFADPEFAGKAASVNNWNFPTNYFPGVGWLGRVHRGTPWQTMYMKSDQPLSTGSSFTWAYSLLPAQYVWVNSTYTYPTNDWALFDLFTAVPNDNAARGLLSVNQTNVEAWAAALGGIIVADPNTGLATPIPPDGQQKTSAIYQMVNSNSFSNSLNIYRSNSPGGTFHHIGDILGSSAWTSNSPFIPASGATSDAQLERIPQQMLGLLKVGSPQFVIYSWGQALKPKQVYPGGPSYLTGICTNYEITGEFMTRTVCHVTSPDGTAAQPKIVVDSYNVIPAD